MTQRLFTWYTREQNNAAIIYDLIATSESIYNAIFDFCTLYIHTHLGLLSFLTVGIHTMLN